jgi:hypothetical protein
MIGDLLKTAAVKLIFNPVTYEIQTTHQDLTTSPHPRFSLYLSLMERNVFMRNLRNSTKRSPLDKLTYPRNSTPFILISSSSRAVGQAVSRRFSTAAARVRVKVRSCGICAGHSGTEASFLLATSFAHCSSLILSIIRGWHYRPNSGDVQSGLSLTPLQETKMKNSFIWA